MDVDFDKRLNTMIEGKTPLIQIISYESLRVHASVMKIAKHEGKTLFIWNRTQGLQKYDLDKGILNEDDGSICESSEILEWFMNEAEKNTMLVLEDFHPDLDSSQPHIINRLRCIARNLANGSERGCNLIMLQPVRCLPIELEKEVQVLELPLPGRKDLTQMMRMVKSKFHISDKNYEESEKLIDSALGLTTNEAWSAFAFAAVDHGRLTVDEIPLIASEKEQVIKKRGHLEFCNIEDSMDDIGGLGRLKDWLRRRENAFSDEARQFGLEAPRGILLLGLPGTGKSLAAKAVANSWKMPLLRLDMGKVFGGIVGKSEENIREALNMAEAISPCVLWVDEIEKGMSGLQSSGATDGGTTSRVLGTFLTWMQEKKKPVFVVATANNIAQLPPELLRKGRMDEIFFVDLPNESERQDILRIHLEKRGRKAFNKTSMKKLAKISKGFTGAEIEEAIKEAMYRAFDEGTDINAQFVEDAILETMPLSRTMSEVIRDTRRWAEGRAVMASNNEPESLDFDKEEKPVVLPQESFNPFYKME